MTKKRKMPTWLRRSLKVFMWLLICIVFIGATVFGLLRTPRFQNYLTQQALLWVSGQTDHKVAIDKVSISWFDEITIENVEVEDFMDSTLLRVGEVAVNYDLRALMRTRRLAADAVYIGGLSLNLTTFNDSTDQNLSVFLESITSLTSTDTTAAETESSPMYLDRFVLDNATIVIDDRTVEPVNDQLDFGHLEFNIEWFEVDDIALTPDAISLKVKQFTGSDTQEDLVIENFSTDVYYSETSLILSDFDFKTQYSAFGDSIALSYPNSSALSYLMDSVSFHIRMKGGKIGKRDIENLLGVADLKHDISFSGIVEGEVSDLTIKNFRNSFGGSHMTLDGHFKGLPEVEETYIDLNLKNTRFESDDLVVYAEDQAEMLESLQWITLETSFQGYLDDFKTKTSIGTGLGEINIDMNIKNPEDEVNAAYEGQLEVIDLQAGKILGDTVTLQQLNLAGSIKGKGLSMETASFHADLTGTDIGVMQYDYDSLFFVGFLAASKFEGRFGIEDPNCQINGMADVDLEPAKETVSLQTVIDTLYLKPLNFGSNDYFIHTTLNWDQEHLDPDSLRGVLEMYDLIVKRDSTASLDIDKFDFSTDYDQNGRRLMANLPGIEISLDGDYTFSNLGAFFSREAHDLASYFDIHVEKDTSDLEPVSADLNIRLGDITQYLDFAMPGLYISEETYFGAHFEQKDHSDAIISAFGNIDSIYFEGTSVLNNELDLYASMSSTSEEILGSFALSSGEQRWMDVPSTHDFQLEGVWYNQEIDLTTIIHQPETDTRVRLENHFQLYHDSITLKFSPSELVALGQSWTFDPENEMSYSDRGLRFTKLALVNGNQRASLDGLLSEVENSSVDFQAQNVDLFQFNSVLGIPFEGILAARIDVFKRLGEPIHFEGDFNLHRFIYKDITVGDIRGNTYYDYEVNGISSFLAVERQGVETIRVSGFYYPEEPEEQLDFNLKFDQADFKLLEFVSEGNLSNVEGKANGELFIKGSAESPQLTGNCELVDANFKVDYLQTIYTLNGKMHFLEDQISFEDFIMTDQRDEEAELLGAIYHQNFGDIRMGLQLRADNFNFLNTTAFHNELFYGVANATGDIFIDGPFEDMVIKVVMRTDRGTRFYIPLTSGGSYDQAEFMEFVNFSDTTNQVQEEEESFNLGLTIDVELEMTTDAYYEIIMDPRKGDIVRGRAYGDLKVIMDKNGNLELYGPLTITEGQYNFTISVINKEFSVKPGSKLIWYGDPYSGVMDLTAIYSLRAAFDDLKPSLSEENPDLAQKQPLNVEIAMSGQMLAPAIDFDMELGESATQVDVIDGMVSEIKSDEQELKKQVISLLVLNRFIPMEESFVGGADFSVGKSLSELVTNQISYLASQVDENLEIEVDLSDLDEEGFNTFQLRLGYTFMDGRLRVTRGGDFTTATSEDQQSNLVSDIIGDWSVEYMLTRDGKLRVKMFSQSNQNQLSTSGQQQMETGLSLNYVTSFNNFSELMSRTRANAIQRKEEDETSEEAVSN